MENANIMALDNIDEMKRFINLYSANDEDRKKVIEVMLTEDPFNNKRIELGGTSNNIAKIVKHYFKVLGLKIKFDKDKVDGKK